DSSFELTGFLDVNYAGCKDTFKSTSGGAHFLGEKLTQLTNYGFHFNKITIYCDSKSDIAISCNPVQHSRTKNIAVCYHFIKEHVEKAIAISCNSVQHSRTKHITVRYHFIKEHVEKGTIEQYFVKTDYQLADIFTKALPMDRFNYLVRRLARTEGIYPGTLPLDRVEVLGASHGPNPLPAYQAPAYQAPGYQAPVHQPLIPQPEVMTAVEFTNYIKANDAILKNIQTNMTSLTNSNLELKNMCGQFMKMNTASSSGSRTLPSNNVTNSKEDLKGITTQSGIAYQGPTSPSTSSFLPKVVERETEVTKDTVPPTKNRSTKDVQPPVVQTETLILNYEPVVAPVIEPVVAPTGKSLIDVFEGELTLRVGKEAITFYLDQTFRYSTHYIDMMVNRIDVIDMACEDYSQEVLGFSDVIVSGNPTPYYDPIISTSSPTLTPFGDSDFLLEEVDAFLALAFLFKL
nr:retrovirus-related Pol polyprotein from transposon TNT 1-94 [Tanacetum cinerariifolium]